MVKIKGRNLRVRIKMLEGEIPLLIEGKTMEDWNMKLDFENQVAKIRWNKGDNGREFQNENMRNLTEYLTENISTAREPKKHII